MGRYGLKIKNIEAAVLYEYNLGVRDYYNYKDAMFVKSLFYDFLMENGMRSWNDKSTRDIVCIKFGFGSTSYGKAMKKLKDQIKKAQGDEKKLEILEQVRQRDEKNKDKFVEKSAEELRKDFYVNGVDIKYVNKDRNGKIKSEEIIHYKMLYRTPGKAKAGDCMFIRDELYDKAIDFLRMGIHLPEKNAPIVEIGAYSSLITSSIVGKVKINPENILIVNDVDSFLETNVVSIETDEDKHCHAKKIENYKLKNTLFDGQALIDSSIFPSWGEGYILLRHHFCKMAAFSTNIQLFFKDYFGNDYEAAKVKDMWGNEHFVKDIELITTDNAVKWLKFDVSYEYWCEWVHKNGDLFGIVKTAHKSKLGDTQRMSYQMVNALDIDIMENVTQCSREYIESLKSDDEAFFKYLHDNSNFSNDFEPLIALCEQDPTFVRSQYFRERKYKIIENYVSNFKNGKVIQNADNLVIVGSPYAMLLHSVGEDVNKDDTFLKEDGVIQCFTGRFDDGEYLAEFRSPFNSKNNLGHLHNVYNDKFFRYFNFGKQIIAINMIGTDFQDKNNGSDQDSDSIYTTNQKNIVEYAKYCCEHYPTIVNNIPKEKNHYNNTLEDFATIDSNLAAANRAIGESSNLAQVALTYTYNFSDQKYIDYVCILSVLAQCAIDNAKRRFDVDLPSEIDRIKEDMDIDENKLPKFWFILKRKDKFSGKKKENKLKTKEKKIKQTGELVCPMNYIYDMKFNNKRSKEETIPMDEFFVKFPIEESKRKAKKIEELIEKYSFDLYNTNVSHNVRENNLLLMENFEELIDDIKMSSISKKYVGLMSWLIDRAFKISPSLKWRDVNSTISKNRPLLMKTLYDVNKEAFLMCFSKNVSKDSENM